MTEKERQALVAITDATRRIAQIADALQYVQPVLSAELLRAGDNIATALESIIAEHKASTWAEKRG